jgi:signal transduction histidine kinase
MTRAGRSRIDRELRRFQSLIGAETGRLAAASRVANPRAKLALITAVIAAALLVAFLIWQFELQRRAGRIDRDNALRSHELSQLREEFVATVSHELRTPLTSIYGFAETLLRQDVLFADEERTTFLGYIASESQRLTQIVDALLNVARLDTGDLKVRITPTDVREVLGEAVHTVQAGTPNGQSFVVDLPEEPVAAKADPEKLLQVFAILLDNAVRYSPAGGTVRVGAERKRDTVELVVEDEGLGIPLADQDQIFRKFYRGTDAEARVGAGGTGLGLFIARGLVTAMGGKISVSSREGEGSTFAIELPLAGSPS